MKVLSYFRRWTKSDTFPNKSAAERINDSESSVEAETPPLVSDKSFEAEGAKFINREINWLAFNGRVLQEAADPTVPLFERMKFLGIFSSNLDDFFRVRVATMKRMLGVGKKAIANLGTGNYNEETAKVYSDHSFFTADRRITDEVKQIFIFLEKIIKPALINILWSRPFK